MREIVPGHVYELDNLHSEHKTHLSFYQDPALHEGHKINGPSTQEVLRACISRVKYLETEQPAEPSNFASAPQGYHALRAESKTPAA